MSGENPPSRTPSLVEAPWHLRYSWAYFFFGASCRSTWLFYLMLMWICWCHSCRLGCQEVLWAEECRVLYGGVSSRFESRSRLAYYSQQAAAFKASRILRFRLLNSRLSYPAPPPTQAPFLIIKCVTHFNHYECHVIYFDFQICQLTKLLLTFCHPKLCFPSLESFFHKNWFLSPSNLCLKMVLPLREVGQVNSSGPRVGIRGK